MQSALRHERVIRPKSGLVPLDAAELWRYRELFWQLAWRNVLVRYKQTILGVAWAVVQPLLTMIIFTVIFGHLAKFDTRGAPYAVFAYAALIPWQFFSNAMTGASNSLVTSQNMLTKVYFPRLIIPASNLMSNTVDFLIALVLALPLMLWFNVPLTWHLLMLPVFFLLASMAALGLGLWLGALNVKYRDVTQLVPFLTRIGIYVSPVAFLSSIVPEKWRLLYHSLNPLVGVIDGFRWCILGSNFEPWWPGFIAGTAVSLLVLITGLYYFRSTERTFADVI